MCALFCVFGGLVGWVAGGAFPPRCRGEGRGVRLHPDDDASKGHQAVKKQGRKRAIQVGVVGVGRGQSFMRAAEAVGMELVAICDLWEEQLESEGKMLAVTTYTDYEEFLSHDMDAVVLANFFEGRNFAVFPGAGAFRFRVLPRKRDFSVFKVQNT